MSKKNLLNFVPRRFGPFLKFQAEFGLLFGAMCWGVIWYPYRLMNEAGVSGLAASFYTYGIAILLAGIFSVKYWRSIPNISLSMGLLSIVAGWTNIAYVLAIIDGEVMRVMLLFYLSPIWTMILAHFWLKERTHLKGVGIILLALFGALIMLFEFPKSGLNAASYTWQALLPLPKKPWEWIALSSGFGFALTNVMTRKSSHLSIHEKSFAVWVGVFVMALLMMLALHQPIPALHVFSLMQWLLLIFIALLLISATVFVQHGVTHVPAMRASVLFLFELVVAAVASYWLANETMQWNEWLGGALIVLAGILSVTQVQNQAASGTQ